MSAEIRAGIEQELGRCATIRAEFTDEAFILLAIVRGWTLERAREEFAKRRVR